jgi:hypothetical protein
MIESPYRALLGLKIDSHIGDIYIVIIGFIIGVSVGVKPFFIYHLLIIYIYPFDTLTPDTLKKFIYIRIQDIHDIIYNIIILLIYSLVSVSECQKYRNIEI